MHPDRQARLPKASKPSKAPKAPKTKPEAKAPEPEPESEPPKFAKKALFDDDDGSDSDSDNGGVEITLKVNEEFAKRFEHNKKREERQRLEEKFKKTGRGSGSGSESESESSDESEDEDAFLATEELDAHISQTLTALRSKDPRIYDKDVKFFPAETEGSEATTAAKKKEKPVFLKDYHRERYLAGAAGASEDEDGDFDMEADKPKTYVEEQAELKKSIMAEINAAVPGDSSDEDMAGEDAGFLKPKEKSKKENDSDVAALEPVDEKKKKKKKKTKITEADVVNAESNPELYLSNFMASRAWANAPDGSNWQAFESDDNDDDEDLEKAEEIEAAYNMRFEDPEKSNEVLKTYARDVAALKSVRREAATGRKRQRELEKERKEEEKRIRREEKARLKKLKMEEAESKLEKIRATAGLSGKKLSDDDLLKILDDVWEDEQWEEQMRKRFGEEYYAEDDDGVGSNDDEEDTAEGEDSKKKKKKKPKKPTWDDDIDITNIVGDLEDDAGGFTLSDIEEPQGEPASGGEEGHGEEGSGSGSDSDERPSKKRKTAKAHKKERLADKRAAKQTRSKLEALVSTRLELDDPDHLASKKSNDGDGARGRTATKPANTFRWRETSPKSFGLTPRDILLAPSDAALNQFAGIKKYSSFRDPEHKRRDKKRLGKKARLRQWRRDVFGREYERTGPDFGFEVFEEEGEARIIGGEKGSGGGAQDGAEEGGQKKKRKRKRSGKKESSAVEAEA